MRRLKHIIYTVLILALVGYTAWRAYPVFKGWLMVSKKDSKNPTGTTVQLAYQLKQDEWTVFPISQGTDFLKFVTNVEYYKTHDETVYYAIKAELVDSAGKVLMNHIFNFKNETKLYRKKQSSRILSNPFLAKGKCYITPNLTFLLSIADFKKPVSIKLKQHRVENVNNVNSVLVRLSSQEPVSDSKKNIMWYRLSPKTRKNLASGNFYPEYMLTETEKQNILSNMWSSIGPQGNSGHDYFVKRIATMPKEKLRQLNLLVKDDPKTEEKNGFKTEMFKLYVNSGLNGRFKTQSAKDIRTANKLFQKLFNGSTASELKKDWDELDMNIVEFKRGKRVFTVIHEKENKLFGRGFYMYCNSSIARNIVLEMPHRYWDIHTGIIGYKLMLTGYFTAAAWNTLHRYQTPNDLSTSSDMAHADNSFFYSFTEAFVDSMPEKSILIQLHGFSNKNQKSYFGKKAAVILSNSTNKPLKEFLYYAERIQKIMPQPAYMYPQTDAKWLAALDNISAKVLRNGKKKQVFIHIEMNDETRLDMLKEAKLREKFNKSIIYKTKKHHPAEDK